MIDFRRRTSYSVVDTTFLCRRLTMIWGLKNPGCEYWGRHLHDTYRVEANGRRAYLRIYRHRWRTRAEVQGEVDLLRYLHRRGADVSYPLRKKDGTYIDQIRAAEGTRHAVLFSEAQGSMPKMDVANSRTYGRLAATIHSHADAYPGQVQRPTLDLKHIAWAPLERIGGFLVHRPRDVAYLRKVAGELAQAIESRLPRSSPEFGLCHGDLHFRNVNRDSAGRFTLFDFDCAGYGWRSHDIAVFLWSRGAEFTRSANLARTRQWNGFLEGYSAVRDLSKTEIGAATLFVPLHHIWVMGLWISLRDGFGQRWLDDSRFDWHLEFVKRWLRIYKPL